MAGIGESLIKVGDRWILLIEYYQVCTVNEERVLAYFSVKEEFLDPGMQVLGVCTGRVLDSAGNTDGFHFRRSPGPLIEAL